jgi:hypothetical protein
VTDPQPYVDVERLLVQWLGSQLACRVVTDLPANLEKQVPLIQIMRLGGGDARPGLDVAGLDVDAYGADRGAAVALAEKARHALRFRLPGTQIDSAVFTRVDTTEAPSFRPYDNTDLRRFGATYRLTIHIVGS